MRKRKGLAEYGLLAQRYVEGFQEKWVVEYGSNSREFLGTGDIQSLADLGNSYTVVNEMRLAPFGLQDMTRLAAATAAPLFPLLLLVWSLEEAIMRVMKVRFFELAQNPSPRGVNRESDRVAWIIAMNKRLLLACLAVAVHYVPHQAWAQFTDAHSYDNTPVGINHLELSYAYVHSDTSIDTSLVIAGAKLNLNQGTIGYTRYFGVLHRLMWAEASVPVGGLAGSISGTTVQGSITGAGDSSYQVAMLLKGGPALSVTQFENYKRTTILGASFTITAPTGVYNPVKILNLGSKRWYFMPELALSHPFGPEQKWQVEAYINSYFYTNNASYHGTEILRQQPLPGVEGHISYSFNDNIWASLDTRYSFRGTTFLNDVDQDNGQHNFILGSEINLSIDNRNSLLFVFEDALVHRNGPTVVGFSVKYDYTWGKGYK